MLECFKTFGIQLVTLTERVPHGSTRCFLIWNFSNPTDEKRRKKLARKFIFGNLEN